MNMLEKAREFEELNKSRTEDQRPVFHMAPLVGWMNDPNGFSLYKGEYHLFFQYYPYDTVWGTMHWGHAKSRDFISWKHLPAAIAPDQPYDRNGCYSGSAIELENDRQLLLYSGVTSLNYNLDEPVEDLPPESDRYQNQCIAVGDGKDFRKLETNPVILPSGVPGKISPTDFRDPKIWKEDDRYYAVISSRSAEGRAEILLYRSEDGFHWEYVSVLFSNTGSYGKMWECPDFFSLDGSDILLVSPMEMKARGLEYHEGHVAMAFLGHYDTGNHVFHDESDQAIDYGIDFYSTQTLETGDGRRIMIAWMQNWGEKNIRMEGLGFFGQNTIPRELHVADGRLIQNPVRELDRYRKNRIFYEQLVLSSMDEKDFRTYKGISGRVLDMTLELWPDHDRPFSRFDIQLARNESFHLLIRFFPGDHLICVDRRNCGPHQKGAQVGKFYVRDRGGRLKLRILLDKYSVELFANDGEQAASYVFYTDLQAEEIRFYADEEVRMRIEKYEICV